MPAKRQTFSGRGLPAAKNARAFEGTEVLVACVRSWGSAFWVFKGRLSVHVLKILSIARNLF